MEFTWTPAVEASASGTDGVWEIDNGEAGDLGNNVRIKIDFDFALAAPAPPVTDGFWTITSVDFGTGQNGFNISVAIDNALAAGQIVADSNSAPDYNYRINPLGDGSDIENIGAAIAANFISDGSYLILKYKGTAYASAGDFAAYTEAITAFDITMSGGTTDEFSPGDGGPASDWNTSYLHYHWNPMLDSSGNDILTVKGMILSALQTAYPGGSWGVNYNGGATDDIGPFDLTLTGGQNAGDGINWEDSNNWVLTGDSSYSGRYPGQNGAPDKANIAGVIITVSSTISHVEVSGNAGQLVFSGAGKVGMAQLPAGRSRAQAIGL